MKDLYSTLGVGKTADAAEIKRSYRKLTQQFHPDKNPGDKQAEDRFKEVSSAYEVLSDPDKRKNYDEFGDMSLTQGFDVERARAYKNATRGGGGGRRPRGAGGFPGGGGGGFDESMFSNMGDARGTSFDDLLSQLFGGGRVVDPFGGGAGGGRARGPVSRRGHDIEGEITIDFMDMLRGKVVPLRIESESGNGRTLDVKVPPGIADGGKLRMRGQGGQGDPNGDILLTVKVAPHPRLKRDGQHLLLSLPVTALEAYRGGPVDVPTPGGTVTLKLKPGSQNGQTLRLKGKGIASPGQEPGDLLVTLDLRLPPPGDAALLAALEQLQAADDPRADLDL